jgi:hypothetical protein
MEVTAATRVIHAREAIEAEAEIPIPPYPKRYDASSILFQYN